MAECECFRIWVNADADGELLARDVEALRTHLAGCAECREYAAGVAAVKARLAAVKVAAPARLEARIRSDIATRKARFDWISRPVTVVAAAALAALVVASFNDPEWAVVGDFASARAVTYVAAGRDALKPQFARELRFRPPVLDAAEVGCTLDGGRVAVIRRQKTAALDYACAGHVVTVYINASSAGAAAPKADMRGGYHVVSWRGPGLACRAVSDADEKTLLRLAGYIQKHAQDA